MAVVLRVKTTTFNLCIVHLQRYVQVLLHVTLLSQPIYLKCLCLCRTKLTCYVEKEYGYNSENTTKPINSKLELYGAHTYLTTNHMNIQ